MNAKKILAFALVALMAVACFAPAFAADKENVMLNSVYFDHVNITPDKNTYDELHDGQFAIGPTHIQGGVNLRIPKDAIYNYYDVNGVEDEEGIYCGFVTYELDKVYTVDSYKLIVIDMAPLGIGVANTIDWLPRSFDILVSTTGEDDSWTLVYSCEALHGEGDDAGEYKFVEETDDLYAYYYVEANFTKAADAKYIKWAVTDLNNDDPSSYGARYFNISELEIYGAAAAGQPVETEPVVTEPVVTEPVVTEPVVTEPVVTEPVVTEPVVTEPVVTEPVVTEPVVTETPDAPATFDFVIVPVVAIAAAAAGAVVLKKKEN